MVDGNLTRQERLAQYIRVSSDEQAKRGFSIPDQKRELDLWAESKGYQVVETAIDDGYESWVLERPGLDRIRDLVTAQAVDMVVVWKRNRLSREPAHMWLLQQEFKDKGVELVCLDSSADDSPEGQLMTGMLDQLLKYELLILTERTRRGTLQKARQGKVIMGRQPNFGFKPDAARDNYLVDEEAMPTVRRVFELINEKGSINGTINTLHAEGTPSPTGKNWSHAVIRRMLLNDVYKPHSPAEVAALTGQPEPDGPRGIWYYNRRTVKRRREAETYKRKTKTTLKPQEEWIAVAVPDAGIDRALVDNARRLVENNVKNSNAGRRQCWELSGGILKCSCGRAMVARTVPRNGRDDFYYICRSYRTRPRVCDHGKHYRADLVEETVAGMVEGLVADRDRLIAHVEERVEAELKRLGRSSKDSSRIAERLSKLDGMRRNYQRQAAEDLITMDELKVALAEIEDERTQLQDMLQAAEHAAKHMAELQREAEIILGIYAGRLVALTQVTPQKRQDIYRRLKLRVKLSPGGLVEIDGDLAASFVPSQSEINVRV
jgi:site-specific DNA recombinase